MSQREAPTLLDWTLKLISTYNQIRKRGCWIWTKADKSCCFDVLSPIAITLTCTVSPCQYNLAVFFWINLTFVLNLITLIVSLSIPMKQRLILAVIIGNKSWRDIEGWEYDRGSGYTAELRQCKKTWVPDLMALVS